MKVITINSEGGAVRHVLEDDCELIPHTETEYGFTEPNIFKTNKGFSLGDFAMNDYTLYENVTDVPEDWGGRTYDGTTWSEQAPVPE